jgi:hypothetical protein
MVVEAEAVTTGMLPGSSSNGVAIVQQAASTVPPFSAGSPAKKVVTITAVEDEEDDVIPGPPSGVTRKKKEGSTGSSANNSSRRSGTGILGWRGGRGRSDGSVSSHKIIIDPLSLSLTDHQWAGQGILASRADLDLPPEVFAAGCSLLQACAQAEASRVTALLRSKDAPVNVNFRDYDRRTALHVAASEGHLKICQVLIEDFGIRINRSDRWGGSPLDDAHRHRHRPVIEYLRGKGALTGSANKTTNLITAAAQGDLDEVQLLVHTDFQSNAAKQKLDINKGDYDKRTALHLA